MTKVITNEYRYNIGEHFFNDIIENDHYLFVSTITSNALLNDTEKDKKEFLAKTLFGKKILPEDVFFAVKNIPWQSGVVYDQYDDSVVMKGKNFYVVVSPEDSNTGDYLVFRCISNNYNARSEAVPFYDDSIEDKMYQMADGYIWEYLFSIEPNLFEKYITYGYIPIFETEEFSSEVKDIKAILIENQNTNRGYQSDNFILEYVVGNEITIKPVDAAPTIKDYYVGQSILLTSTSNEVDQYVITSYEYDSTFDLAKITIDDTDSTFSFVRFPKQSSCVITPTIKVRGNGYGAKAFPLINSNGQIERIQMIDGGYGYTEAVAEVVDPLYGFNPNSIETDDEKAIVRPILTTAYTDDTSSARKLLSNHIILYSGITEADNISQSIPVSNTYCRIGLVKNPYFESRENNEIANTSPEVFDNRIKINIEDDIVYTVGSNVQQVDENNKVTFNSTVHSIDANTIYLAEFNGPYQGAANNEISFDVNSPIRDQNNNTYVINSSNVTLPNYVQKSGEVLYMTSYINPINRSSDSNEKYKLVLQF